MDYTIFYVLGALIAFFVIRSLLLTYITNTLRRKSFQQEYVTVLNSPQFKVKDKYES